MLLQRSIRLLPLAAVVVGCVASQAIEPTDVMSEEFVSTRAPCGNNCPPWEPLGFPDEVVISDGDTVTMRMVEHFFDSYVATFYTRAYSVNGMPSSVPGPTFRVKKGAAFSVLLINELGANHPGPSPINSFRDCNTTNLHMHGFHDSPYRDTVLVAVEPSVSKSTPSRFTFIGNRTYNYQLPATHMPGTMWYHPHFHGSTAIQVGGGAAGVIIIEDSPEDVPEYVRNAKEMVLVLQNWYMTDPKIPIGLLNVSAASKDHLVLPHYKVTDNYGVQNVTGNQSDYWWTMNGQVIPTMTVTVGEPVRWRLASTSMDQALKIVTTNGHASGPCTFDLIAKDGVYLRDAPRRIPIIYLSPGSRADVLVTCKFPGTFKVESIGGRLAKPGDPCQAWLASIKAVPSPNPPVPMPKFKPGFPDYLADLQTLPPSVTTDDWSIFLAINQTLHFNINGKAYDNKPQKNISTGRVAQWEILQSNNRSNGGWDHPLHLHVWPYQITKLTGDTEALYYQVGDWHDTIQLGLDRATGERLQVRFQTSAFNGTAMLHCHILGHEDLGMMTQVFVHGEEKQGPIKSTQRVCTVQNGSNWVPC